MHEDRASDDHVEAAGRSEDLVAAVLDMGREQGWEAAATLIGARWDQYATTNPTVLLEAIGALPGRVLLENAGLVVAANYLRDIAIGGDPSRFTHDRQLPAVPPTSGPIAEQLILLTGTAASARTTGDTDRALVAAQEGRRRYDDARDDPARSAELDSARGNLPHLFLQWGLTIDAADTHGAAFEYEEAHHLALLTEQAEVARRAAAHLAWHYAERGSMARASRWLRKASTSRPDPRYEAITHLAGALIALEARDWQHAGVELARLRAYPAGEYWAQALWVRSLHATTPTEAAILQSEFVSELQQHPEPTRGPVDNRYIRTVRLTLGIDADRTEPHSNTAPDLMLDAVEAFARGALEDALELTHLPVAATPTAVPRVRGTALLLAAAISVALDRNDAAADFFDRGSAILAHEGMTTPYRILPPEILAHLTTAAGKHITVDRGIEPAPVPMTLGSLTPRERELLALLTTRATLAEIAATLYLSINTIKTTANRLYRKLNVNSRKEAVAIAHRAGITPETPSR